MLQAGQAICPYSEAWMSTTSRAISELEVPRSAGALESVKTLPARTPAWLGPFFALAGTCAPLAHIVKPAGCRGALLVLPHVRAAIRQNSLRIFGKELSQAEEKRFARNVMGSFFDFVVDVARTSRMTAQELGYLVEEVEGLEAYRAVRAKKCGAILVTAHIGTFEAGLAALADAEKKVRVVFKRDAVAGFEHIRSKLRDSLGIIEAPIDDGIGTWLSLREALLNDEVVVIQGDRAEPGQKSEVVPFLHGHLRLPTGPVRLAQLTGAPIIPVFALPSKNRRYRVLLKSPIEAQAVNGPAGTKAMLSLLAEAIASVVRDHPEQWLALEPVFYEDGAHAQR